MNVATQIEALRKELHEHNKRYYVQDAPIISDQLCGSEFCNQYISH